MSVTEIKLLYTTILDFSMQEVITSLGITSPGLDRLISLWNSYTKIIPLGETISIDDFVRLNDLDDKEKVFIGAMVLRNLIYFKIKIMQD